MRLTIVRHAQTTGNVGAYLSWPEEPLSELGQEQARYLGERLKNQRFDVVFISTYPRTHQTIKPFLNFHTGPLHVDHRIHEQNFGSLTGKPHGSLTEAAEKQGLTRLSFKPENGESVSDMRGRIGSFFDEIKEKYRGNDVLVISHGGPIINLLFKILNHPEERYKELAHSNTGVTLIEFDESGKPRIHYINDTSHLPEEKRTR